MSPPLDPLDPALLGTRPDSIPALKVELSAQRRKRGQHYLPALAEQVFCQLIQLPYRAWAVYSVLLLRCRLNRSQTVVLTSCFLARFGLTRTDKSRALVHLERVGLIAVERRDRHNPTVTLLPTSEGS